MRISLITSGMILTVVVLSPIMTFSQERRAGGVGVTVFTEPDFGGRSATFRDDMPNLLESGLNDRIVSLRVAQGEVWEVCEHSEYRGRCLVVDGPEPDLSRNGWSHTISSVRRVRGPRGNRGRQAGRGGVVLYARTGFLGEQVRVSDAVADLSELDFDDRAMSLRIRPGERWEICAETRFRDCQIVENDSRDLRELGMRRRISSLRPR